MTQQEFKATARKFVEKTLKETQGKKPSRKVVAQTTAKLVNNFKPILSRTK
jgi:hypothetical protein